MSEAASSPARTASCSASTSSAAAVRSLLTCQAFHTEPGAGKEQQPEEHRDHDSPPAQGNHARTLSGELRRSVRFEINISKAPRPGGSRGLGRRRSGYFLTLIVVVPLDATAFEFAAGLKVMVTL